MDVDTQTRVHIKHSQRFKGMCVTTETLLMATANSGQFNTASVIITLISQRHLHRIQFKISTVTVHRKSHIRISAAYDSVSFLVILLKD